MKIRLVSHYDICSDRYRNALVVWVENVGTHWLEFKSTAEEMVTFDRLGVGGAEMDIDPTGPGLSGGLRLLADRLDAAHDEAVKRHRAHWQDA